MPLLQIILNSANIIPLAIIAVVGYVVTLAVYRLYLSPISHIPGPKIAAVTFWYEFYYDVILKGRYTYRIAELHEEYGPIVRINPYELHVNDPDFYDTLYVPGPTRRTHKDAHSMRGFGPPRGAFSTLLHEQHRVRRAAISPFFSTSSVTALEPTITSAISRFLTHLAEAQSTGSIVNLNALLPCLTTDIITDYCFNISSNFLSDPNGENSAAWRKSVLSMSETFWVYRHMPFLEKFSRSLPLSFVLRLSPWLAAVFTLESSVRDRVLDVKANMAAGVTPESRTVLYDMLSDSGLSESDKETESMTGEGLILVAAGSITVAHTLAITCFHLIRDQSVRHKLRNELASVDYGKDGFKYSQLQGLPYLSAVVFEGLRWSSAVPHRLLRVSPDVELVCAGYKIPRGTAVGMSAGLVHRDSRVFPQPDVFSPERWMEHKNGLKKYLVAFSKGSRQCVGINLAYAEMYLIIAEMFRPGRFDFELFETDLSDVETYHDLFNAFAKLDSKGVRIVVK